jgi:DNA-binding LytR/AlgR family response regulator
MINTMPLRVAIVDDEPVICDLMQHYINQWCLEFSIEVKIDVFGSAEAFSFEWETSRAYDLILLDIQMKGASGIVLAKQIRNLDQWMRIIFITGLADYVYEGYEVSALNYLLKPVSKDKLFSCLSRAYDAIKKTVADKADAPFIFEFEGQIHRIEQKKIQLIEAQKNYTQLSTERGNFLIRMRFSEIESQLNKALFVKAHRSFMVNVMNIQYIDTSEIVLDNSKKIPLSRSQRNYVQQAFIHYHKNQERNRL